MGFGINQVHIWLLLILTKSTSEELDIFGQGSMMDEERWLQKGTTKVDLKISEWERACASMRPSDSDMLKRFISIVPYFDREHDNAAFLHKLRVTMKSLASSGDPLDREAAFYSAAFIPLVFLQQYRDTWCLLERFHRALRLYQTSHPTEKRSSLKLMQNLKSVTLKLASFLRDLPVVTTSSSRRPRERLDGDEVARFADKKGDRYLKELIKNLG